MICGFFICCGMARVYPIYVYICSRGIKKASEVRMLDGGGKDGYRFAFPPNAYVYDSHLSPLRSVPACPAE